MLLPLFLSFLHLLFPPLLFPLMPLGNILPIVLKFPSIQLLMPPLPTPLPIGLHLWLLPNDTTPINFQMLPPSISFEESTSNELELDVTSIPSTILQMAHLRLFIPLSMLTTAILQLFALCKAHVNFDSAQTLIYLRTQYLTQFSTKCFKSWCILITKKSANAWEDQLHRKTCM
ncbi:hypothetical protein K439DRAFT_1611284 [Ramaria rubella]|nr:hypothetical protein K439DRAFT_1611284 [Ramaria rubella]